MKYRDAFHYRTEVNEVRKRLFHVDDAVLASWLEWCYGPGSSGYARHRKEAIITEAAKRLRWGTLREKK